jgi:hypothetical protein
MKIFTINNTNRILCPFLNLNFKCSNIKRKSKINVKMAGYILKADVKSP